MMMANSNALKSSALYIGYLILKEIQKQGKDKVSIYDVSKTLKKKWYFKQQAVDFRTFLFIFC